MSFLTKIIPYISPLLQTKLWCDTLSVPADSKHNDKNLESKLKQQFTPFLNQHGLRSDLAFHVIPNPGICMARGTNCFTGLQAGILISPKFQEADPETLSWTLKHEVAHIKGNDMFTIPLVAVIAALATAILLPSLVGCSLVASLVTFVVANLISTAAMAVFSRWRESVADDFANEHSSVEELKGGARFLQAVKQLETGNDILHPSIASRLEKIEKELQKRGESLKETPEHNALVSRVKEVILEVNKPVPSGNQDTQCEPASAC